MITPFWGLRVKSRGVESLLILFGDIRKVTNDHTCTILIHLEKWMVFCKDVPSPFQPEIICVKHQLRLEVYHYVYNMKLAPTIRGA